MDISDKARQNIVEEIQTAVGFMRETADAAQKLYAFSAIYSAIQRIYNIEYDDDLMFAHLVINSAYQAFSQRLVAVRQGDMTVVPSDEQLSKLSDLSEELGEHIERSEEIVNTLRRIVVLSYSVGGNGNYLMKKGVLKI